jgi:hypothetical protein
LNETDTDEQRFFLQAIDVESDCPLILLRQVVTEEGWSAALERMEGELLGYEKWQSDIFIEYMKRVREERKKDWEKWRPAPLPSINAKQASSAVVASVPTRGGAFPD